jgi:hypothetical protein
LNLPTGEWYFAALAIGPDQGKLYLNGADTTATNVAEHLPGQFDSLIRVARDHNDDRIMTSTIDEVRLYNKTLGDADIVAIMLGLSDVTAAGDVVQGVPNDGDWPGGETPDLAVDDNTGTKYLHFKGETEASGFQITPAVGPTVVTGLTFTSANDAEPRDPVTYELSGSNESIEGPYVLIASGDIADFAQADPIARFTKGGTPILFENAAAYTHYQVMFPTVRDAGSANSMQIAEVELLGIPAIVLPVSINFQQTGGDVPEGYLPDGGEVFDDRGNGYSYGWNMDSTGGARNRNNADAPDERDDTTHHIEKGEDRIWEIELPN